MNTAQPMYGWKNLPWTTVQRKVFKLQKRIYQASRRNDFQTVHRLQKLLVKSWSARCLAVRKVTQDNLGKRTAGVDGKSQLTEAQRIALVGDLKDLDRKPDPLRRIYIPKSQGEARPLGIPTMRDRAMQALVKLALEPEWEAKFEPNSYGFRPGRSCHDAIEAIFKNIMYKPRFVLDADIKGCFDNINHNALLAKLNTFPTFRRIIRHWLKAGILEGDGFSPTEQGTPQGGVISPLLANIALHGLEQVVMDAFPKETVKAGKTPEYSYKPKVVRYADDFVVMHHHLDVIVKCKNIVQTWLKGMGLELKESKTRITHTLEHHEGRVGFDFLGFNVRQHRVGKTHRRTLSNFGRAGKGVELSFKTIITPSKTAIKRHYEKVAGIIVRHNATSQESLIERLNPVVRGWCNYYKTVVSGRTFNRLDHLMVKRLLRWAYRRHGKVGRRKVVAKYFNPQRNKTRTGRCWDFATPQGLCLYTYADTSIGRHIKVQGNRSPFDGDWLYWSQRLKHYPSGKKRVQTLLKRQQGRCIHCELYFSFGDLLEIHRTKPGSEGGKYAYTNMQLLHAHCHKEVTRTKGIHDKNHVIEEPCELETLTHGSEDKRGG